jgi:hypothetical protein
MRGKYLDTDPEHYSVDSSLSTLAGLVDAAGLRRVGGGAEAWPGRIDVICGVS